MSENRKVWKAYQRELATLEKEIEEYEREDMAEFEVKVHGIKGASKQLGELELSNYAEMLEHAAKRQDREFIHNHVQGFIEEITKSRIRAEEKMKMLKPKTESTEAQQDTIALLFNELQKGFELYNIDMIEDRLSRLEKKKLSPKEQRLADMAREACDNLEYETGCELLAEYK